MTQPLHNDEDNQVESNNDSDLHDLQPSPSNEESLPEPPVRWKPRQTNTAFPDAGEFQDSGAAGEGQGGMVGVGSTRFKIDSSETAEFLSARRFITIAQVCAIVSLFFGGILLSSVAVVCAFIARNKLAAIAASHADEPEVCFALKRTGMLILAVAFGALALNAIFLVLFYPMVMDAVQSGGLGSVMGTSGTAGSGTGGSTWG